jgi:prepilin-type N-terminal cleavage/methylation domain-containing protein
MSALGTQPPHRFSGEQGVTLIELLVSMLIALVVSFAAFSILQFTSDDVSRITSRAQVDQTGRVALEKVMLQLHSACVAVTVNPIWPKSTGTTIKFVSETSPLNSSKEPISSLSTVHLHEITYNESTGTLTEKSRLSSGTTPEFTFNEHETPEPTVHTLLTGVKQTGSTPIFQYYRYYQSSDSKVKLGEAKLGELDPTALTTEQMAKEEVVAKVKVTEAEKVAKVTVGFTLKPESHESVIAKGDQPIALEDSAVLRFTPSSEESANTNDPCAQI